jgi:hypothetical protein
MSSRRRSGGFWGKILLVVVVGTAAGLGLGLLKGRQGENIVVMKPRAEEPTDLSEREIKSMSRAQLERKVVELTRLTALKDKQIGELMIENKILSAGSSASGSR